MRSAKSAGETRRSFQLVGRLQQLAILLFGSRSVKLTNFRIVSGTSGQIETHQLDCLTGSAVYDMFLPTSIDCELFTSCWKDRFSRIILLYSELWGHKQDISSRERLNGTVKPCCRLGDPTILNSISTHYIRRGANCLKSLLFASGHACGLRAPRVNPRCRPSATIRSPVARISHKRVTLHR